MIMTTQMLNRDVTDNGTSGSPILLWRFAKPALSVSTAVVGGGIGTRHWWLNTTVPAAFHDDPVDHLQRIAESVGLTGPGIAMMTALDVNRHTLAVDDGVEGVATVGVGWPTWAADRDDAPNPYRAGTINLCLWVPVRLSHAALANAATSAVEAKAQALMESGVPGTGTASDAICVLCPTHGAVESYGGPRSTWGARVARVAHRLVLDGLAIEPNQLRSTPTPTPTPRRPR